MEFGDVCRSEMKRRRGWQKENGLFTLWVDIKDLKKTNLSVWPAEKSQVR